MTIPPTKKIVAEVGHEYDPNQKMTITFGQYDAIMQRLQNLEQNVQTAQLALPHYNFPHPYHNV